MSTPNSSLNPEKLDINMFRKAVVDHARYLGIDPEKDKDFLWLAEEALLAQLPDDWEIYTVDPDESQIENQGEETAGGQNYYYYNKNTGQSSWENPLDEPYRQLFQKLKHSKEQVRDEASRSICMRRTETKSVHIPAEPPIPVPMENPVRVVANLKPEEDDDEYIQAIIGHRSSCTENGQEFEYLVRWSTSSKTNVNSSNGDDSNGDSQPFEDTDGSLEWFLAEILMVDHKDLVSEYNEKFGIDLGEIFGMSLKPSPYALRKGNGKSSSGSGNTPLKTPLKNLNKSFDNNLSSDDGKPETEKELENMLSAKQMEVEKLQHENEEKTKEIKALEVDLNNQKQKVADLEAQRLQVRKEIESKTQERLENLSGLHRNELVDMENEVKELRFKENEILSKLQMAESKLRKSCAENDKLKSSIDKLTMSNQGIESSLLAEKEKRELLSKQLKDAEKLHQEKEIQIGQTENKIMQLQETIDAMQRQKNRTEKDKEFLESMMANVKKELDSELSINLSLRQEVGKSTIELEQTKRDLHRLSEELNRARQMEENHAAVLQELEEKKSECTLLLNKVSSLHEQLQVHKDENMSTSKEMLSANNRAEMEHDLSKIKTELESAQAERNSLQTTLNSVRMSVIQGQDEIAKLTANLMSEKERSEALERKNNRLESEQKLLETALERVKSELESELKTSESLRQKISKIESEHAAELRSLRSAETENKLTYESNIRQLRATIEMDAIKLNDAKKQQEALNSEIEELLNEKKTTIENQTRWRADSAEISKKLKETEANLENLKRENSSLQSTIKDYKIQLEEKDNSVDQMKSENLTQRESLGELRRSKERLEGQIRALQQSLEGEKVKASNVQSMTERLEAYQEEIAALKDALQAEKVKAANTRTSSDDEEKARLERALSRCKEEMDIALQARSKQLELEKETALLELRRELEENAGKSDEYFRELQSLKKETEQVEIERSQTLQHWKDKYEKERTLRRKLHNKVVDLQGNIRVYCRVRPVLDHELKRNSSNVIFLCDSEAGNITLAESKTTMLRDQDEQYEFDRVFGQNSTQEEVFSHVEPLATSVLDGYNVCIFAYGQTGSGKTYTMDGAGTNPGVNQRTLESIFRLISESTSNNEMSNEHSVCSVKLSMLEIYNETIRDLLNPEQKNRKKLDIRCDPATQELYVPGLTEVSVKCMDDVIEQMKIGRNNRTVGAHNINEHSSRSHLVVTVTVMNKYKGKACRGKLNLIDLAGSERINKTEATGSRLMEAKSINKSLSALGNVIQALGSKEKKKHVPFRDSKLTYLLQDCLNGSSKVMMFVNISPVEFNFQESMCSIKFAKRCASISLGQAKRNTESEQIVALKQTIDDLRSKLK